VVLLIGEVHTDHGVHGGELSVAGEGDAGVGRQRYLEGYPDLVDVQRLSAIVVEPDVQTGEVQGGHGRKGRAGDHLVGRARDGVDGGVAEGHGGGAHGAVIVLVQHLGGARVGVPGVVLDVQGGLHVVRSVEHQSATVEAVQPHGLGVGDRIVLQVGAQEGVQVRTGGIVAGLGRGHPGKVVVRGLPGASGVVIVVGYEGV